MASNATTIRYPEKGKNSVVRYNKGSEIRFANKTAYNDLRPLNPKSKKIGISNNKVRNRSGKNLIKL